MWNAFKACIREICIKKTTEERRIKEEKLLIIQTEYLEAECKKLREQVIHDILVALKQQLELKRSTLSENSYNFVQRNYFEDSNKLREIYSWMKTAEHKKKPIAALKSGKRK